MEKTHAINPTTDYRVWSDVKAFPEQADHFAVVAQFRFLQEALDYVDYAVKRGIGKVVLTGPCGMASIYPREEKEP